MRIHRLLIRDFRNIESFDAEFSEGFNFLVGGNGSGKTSLLEAIYFLGHGRSFKSSQISRVIRHSKGRLILHAQTRQAAMFCRFGVYRSRDGQNQIKINGERGKKLAQLAEKLPMQLIDPDSFELLLGGPKYRRAFLDWGVFHVEPLFHQIWSQFKKIAKQRNALLKTASNYQQMQAWDRLFVPLVEQIHHWRQNYVESLLPKAQALCSNFLPDFEINFDYRRGWESQSAYADVLVANFERDRMFGYTQSGVHKADLVVRVGNTPVADLLSRGQLKLLVCALRLAQGQILASEHQKSCIYLIDDFASELDEKRRSLLIEQLKLIQSQVFVSAISADQIAEMRHETSKMFHVEHGKITAL